MALATPWPLVAEGDDRYLWPLGARRAEAAGGEDGRRLPYLIRPHESSVLHRTVHLGKHRRRVRPLLDERTRPQPGESGRHQPAPKPAARGNVRSVKHGAYSKRLKSARVREVVEELLAEHPQEAPANLRAIAELFVTAERLSEWVAQHDDEVILQGGTPQAALLEARKSWVNYLQMARELGITCRGRREIAGLAEVRDRPGSKLLRHLRGEDDGT